MPDAARGVGKRTIAIWIRHQINSGPSTRPEGDEGMPEHTIVGKMKTDERGWPQIHFAPENDTLHTVAAFLQEDVGAFLPSCDDLLQASSATGPTATTSCLEKPWSWPVFGQEMRCILALGERKSNLLSHAGAAPQEETPRTRHLKYSVQSLDRLVRPRYLFT
jgi:hypothetical protein